MALVILVPLHIQARPAAPQSFGTVALPTSPARSLHLRRAFLNRQLDLLPDQHFKNIRLVWQALLPGDSLGEPDKPRWGEQAWTTIDRKLQLRDEEGCT